MEAEITLSWRLPIDRHLYRLADRTEFLLHKQFRQMSIRFPTQDLLAEMSVLARASNET
jgi:hypothetical protein